MEIAYSIKMRASKNNKHISGGETIVFNENEINNIVNEYIKRALNHNLGKPNFINLKIEQINKNNIKYINSLPIKTINCKNKLEGREIAKNILLDELSKYTNNNSENIEKLIEKAFKIIDTGNMRGASILNLNGERLEPNKNRGVRVKNIAYTKELKEKIINNKLYTERTIDGITIASKVIDLGVIAELCTSDNKDYTTGYIATKKGYFRINNLKNKNDNGGRVFFVNINKNNNKLIKELINNLENKPYVVK